MMKKSGTTRFVCYLALYTLLLLHFFLVADPVLGGSLANRERPSEIYIKEMPTLSIISESEDAGHDASQTGSGTEQETPRPFVWNRTIRLKSGGNIILTPAGDLYPKYMADPRHPTFSIMRMRFSNSDIDDAGNLRWGLRLGARFGLLRFHKDGDKNHGLQVDIEAGFIGQFDIDNSTDNIGWDGIYGLHLAWAPAGGIAFRLGTLHNSSHVGDEYAERTGRVRIKYTREEYVFGVSWSFEEKWRAYAEAGYGHVLRNDDLMEPWRVQYGLEYVSPHGFWHGRLGWYAAADVSSYEESDWDINTTLQAGLILPVIQLSRNYRLGLEYYSGRSHFGEFFQDDESYLSLGLWFDI
jgi:hypothetical protein